MTRTKIEQLELDKKLEPFYDIKGKEYLCRKCNQNIKTSRESHYSRCTGLGTLQNILSSTQKSEFNYSTLCDMGCGQISQFNHKNGKSYCSRFGAKCPIKIEKDSILKKGINPFENIKHHGCTSGILGWNKGLTKETSSSIQNQINTRKITYSIFGHQRKSTSHTPETKQKLSKIAFDRKIGGYQKGSGIGKKGWYKGFYCDSSWELAYVIYCLDHHIPIKRNLEPRKYIFEGKVRKYIPDFIMNNDPTDIVEIKGYDSLQVKAKMEANPDVKVLYGEDLKHVFKYVKEKYGNKFISLYEKVEK